MLNFGSQPVVVMSGWNVTGRWLDNVVFGCGSYAGVRSLYLRHPEKVFDN